MLTYSCSGKIGDILYSLYFCKQFGKIFGKKFNFNIQINILDDVLNKQNKIVKAPRMSIGGYNMLKKLLQKQSYINQVTYSQELPKEVFNLDIFRVLKIHLQAGDIRNYFYQMSKYALKRQFWKPILKVGKNDQYKDKIILIKSERYNNIYIDYSKLEMFKNDIVFMGIQEQYIDFCKNYFQVQRAKIVDFNDAAEKMMGAKVVIGNQTGLYALAQCIKCNRIFIPCQYYKNSGNKIVYGPKNVIPLGGKVQQVCSTQKLIQSVKEFIK